MNQEQKKYPPNRVLSVNQMMRMNFLFGILLAVLAVPLMAQSEPEGLRPWLGSWETRYQSGDQSVRELWRFTWNEKHTFLNLREETWTDGVIEFVGVGFLLFDVSTTEYRLYMAMDNGVLHESVGRETEHGVYRLAERTYGNPAIGDMEQVFDFSGGGLIVTYWTLAEGKRTPFRQEFKKVGR